MTPLEPAESVQEERRRPLRRSAKPGKAKADELFSKVVRLRDGCCQRCGRSDMLQCAHIVSRRYFATRWRESNAMALCVGDHKYFTEHPLEWDVFVALRIGRGPYDLLKADAMDGLAGRTDYKALIASLRSRLQELESVGIPKREGG